MLLLGMCNFKIPYRNVASSVHVMCTNHRLHRCDRSRFCAGVYTKGNPENMACNAGVWMLYCMVAYCYVIYSMGQMLQSAISESADATQRQGLLFIYYGTVVIWSAFVAVWFGQELGMLSIYRAELGNMLANFSAKVTLPCMQNIHSTVFPLEDVYHTCLLCCWVLELQT